MKFRWDGCLFDADGTLLDTKEMIYKGFSRTLEKWARRSVTPEEVEALVGLPFRVQLEYYLGPLADSDFLRIADDFRSHQYRIYADYLGLCPGVSGALKRLRELKVPMGIVTSRSLPSLSCYLDHTGLSDYFSVIVTPADTVLHKPDPQPVQRALELLSLEPSRTLMVGDAVFDIQSGQGAGCETAFTRWSSVDLGDTRPDYFLDSMMDLFSI